MSIRSKLRGRRACDAVPSCALGLSCRGAVSDETVAVRGRESSFVAATDRPGSRSRASRTNRVAAERRSSLRFLAALTIVTFRGVEPFTGPDALRSAA